MSSGETTHSIDRLAAEQLRHKLLAATTRVLDCVRLYQVALKAGVTPDHLMFHKPDLNRIIERFLDEAMADEAGRLVGTELYFTYNKKDAYEGGRSIFFSDKTLRSALHFQTGIAPDDRSAAFSRVLPRSESAASIGKFIVAGSVLVEGSVECRRDERLRQLSGDIRRRIHQDSQFCNRAVSPDGGNGVRRPKSLRDSDPFAGPGREALGGQEYGGPGAALQAMQMKAEDGPPAFYAWKAYDLLRLFAHKSARAMGGLCAFPRSRCSAYGFGAERKQRRP
jgi:hypothetical protein